jgi:hypothetical protein
MLERKSPLRKLIFPALTVWWVVCMLFAREFPNSWAAGADVEFLIFAIICAVISWIGFVKG